MKLSDINPHIRYAATHYHHVQKDFDSICYDCRLFFIKVWNIPLKTIPLYIFHRVQNIIFIPIKVVTASLQQL